MIKKLLATFVLSILGSACVAFALAFTLAVNFMYFWFFLWLHGLK